MPVKALAATRQALDDALLMDFESALKNESRLQSRLGFSADYQEGTRAFLEKRKPVFTER